MVYKEKSKIGIDSALLKFSDVHGHVNNHHQEHATR